MRKVVGYIPILHGPTTTLGITTIWDIIYNKTPEMDILETLKTIE
jgi:hypothetical protein